MKESELLRRVMLAFTNAGARLFRNNVGVLQDRHGNYVHYGLCVGSSDLIGYHSIKITPDMVGRRVAVFAAVECKSQSGRMSEEQERFLAAVENAGGIAIEARDVERAVNQLKQRENHGNKKQAGKI